MPQLIAENLFRDPQTTAALQQLAHSLKQHQGQITTIKKADPDRQKSYAATISEFSQLRSGNLFYPYIGSGIGNGVFVELLDGSIKYDFIIGIGVHLLGHSHPKIVEACLKTALENTVMLGHLQQNASSHEFSKLLLGAANAKGSKLAHCFLSSTGVMADENAIKIAFQKNHPRHRILAFEKCFMGRTLALSQITDKPGFREGLPLNYKIDYIPFYDELRPQESTAEALAALKKHIVRYPDQHALMAFELVQGESGFNPGSREFFTALMDELKKNDIAILVDEVQTFGRSSQLFAFQHFGLDSYVDLVTVGKASQVCATLFTESYKPKPGLLSQTFIASASAIAAGQVIVQELLSGGYFGANGRNLRLHAHFKKKLEELAKKHPALIKGPYGIGGMVAFTPFGGDNAKVTKFVHALFQNGVMGFVAGANPTRARFLLPVGAVQEHHIDEVTTIIEQTLLALAKEEKAA